MSAQRRYWDSDVFLGWLRNERDKAPKCEGVLAEAEAGRMQIVTSALTLTEVIRLKGQPRLSRTDESSIRAFFEHDWIVVRDVDRFIAEDARELVWNYGIQAEDAIHLATALSLKLSQFDTFDRVLHKLSGKLGVPLLTIGPPDLPYQEKLDLGERPKKKD